MDIKKFCVEHDIDMSKCGVSISGGSFTLVDLETSPIEFLNLAEEDFQRGGLSARLNATTNAKRAIVSQMDQLLISLGYKSFDWKVPRKIAQVQALGLFTPGIVRKMIKLRNTLEHEYKAPTLLQAGEIVDIASLFVMSMSAMFIPFDDELQFSLVKASARDRPIKYLTAGLHRDAGSVFYTVYAYKAGDSKEVCLGQCNIPSGHVLFDPLVKLSASLMMKYKVDQACKDFDAVYATL
jgi:hypothetical protein